MSERTIMKPDRIVVHCTATKNLEWVNIESIRDDHKRRGFSDIGYHGLIQPNGEWQDGRPLNVVGAHVEGHNTGAIGIALVGSDKFTKNQFDKLYDKIEDIRRCFSIDPWQLYCHYQFDTAVKQGKTCPNIPINNLLYFLSNEDYRAVKEFMAEAI